MSNFPFEAGCVVRHMAGSPDESLFPYVVKTAAVAAVAAGRISSTRIGFQLGLKVTALPARQSRVSEDCVHLQAEIKPASHVTALQSPSLLPIVQTRPPI